MTYALGEAAREGHLDVIRALLDNGASVDGPAQHKVLRNSGKPLTVLPLVNTIQVAHLWNPCIEMIQPQLSCCLSLEQTPSPHFGKKSGSFIWRKIILLIGAAFFI